MNQCREFGCIFCTLPELPPELPKPILVAKPSAWRLLAREWWLPAIAVYALLVTLT